MLLLVETDNTYCKFQIPNAVFHDTQQQRGFMNIYGVGAIEISFFGKVSHWWSDQIAISRARVW